MRSLRILITDANTTAGLGAVRSLGRAGHHVTAGCSSGMDEVAFSWSRYCSRSVRHPDPVDRHFEFREWIRQRANANEFDVLLPITEASVTGVAAVRNELPSGVLPVLPSDVSLRYTLSKFYSTRAALSVGIACPATEFVCDDLAYFKSARDLSKLRFPLVIKTDNHLTADGVYRCGRTFIAEDNDAADRVLERLGRERTRIIAQEFVNGSGAGAFVLRFGGKVHLTFAHRRLHEVPYSGGWSSFRESCFDDEVIGLAERILDEIGYEGVAMVEFRRRAGDGKPFFLEINGRLWGSIALALHCGVDFPKALIECYQNGGCETAQPRSYRSGVKCRNLLLGECAYLLSVWRAKNVHGVNPPPSKTKALLEFVLLTLDPRIRHDYFWWSDPLPALYQAVDAVTRLTRKICVMTQQKLANVINSGTTAKLRPEHVLRWARSHSFRRQSRVLFVCYGNICRSAFAEAYANAKLGELSLTGLDVSSAGFHPRESRATPAWFSALAAEYGVDLTKHRSRLLNDEIIIGADAIFVMDQRNYDDMIHRFPSARKKIYFLGAFSEHGVEIADPYDMDRQAARECLQHLVQALEGVLQPLARQVSDLEVNRSRTSQVEEAVAYTRSDL